MLYTVLIADDSATTRAFVRKVLGLTGLEFYAIHEAGDGVEAMRQMRDHWIDLVIVDLNMPLMDGADMLCAIQADPLLRSIPTVVLSSEGTQTVLDSFSFQGLSQILHKPVEAALLKAVVLKVLRGLS